MPKILKSVEKSLTFEDQDGSYVLYYRSPTTAERVEYSNSIVRRVGGKIVTDMASARVSGGLSICTGVRDGDFAIPASNKDGYKLISSDPKSKAYSEDWKALLEQYCADFLMLLGAKVFEGTTVADGEDVGK
jgi:hypothetical protein